MIVVMKRIYTAAAVVVMLAFLCSCEDGNGLSSEGTGNLAGECILPLSAKLGGEVIIQWNGFSDDVSLALVTSDGTRFPVEDLFVSSSGVSFTVPVSLTPGVYQLVLDGEKELGSIEILYPDMPIVGLVLPSYAESGGNLSVGGAGFDASASLMLVTEDGTEIPLDVVLENAGLCAGVPKETDSGSYELYLLQDGLSWLLDDDFRIIKIGGDVKRLVSLSYYVPYSGSIELCQTWDIHYGASPSLRFTESYVEGDDVTVYGYDDYVSVAEASFELIDGLEYSNDLSISYVLDEQGGVESAAVVRYRHEDEPPFEFMWNYDGEGYLQSITYENSDGNTVIFRSLEYEDGNLTKFRTSSFFYDDELFNAPGAADVVLGFMALNELDEPSVHIPYLLGWYAKTSVNLPSAMTVQLDSGLSSKVKLNYEFDEEGYVTAMSWKRGRSNERVTFRYDLI